MTTRPARRAAACSPASAGVRWPRGPSRSGRGSVPSTMQQVGAVGERDELLVGAESAP